MFIRPLIDECDESEDIKHKKNKNEEKEQQQHEAQMNY
jgi:hypothetical protein